MNSGIKAAWTMFFFLTVLFYAQEQVFAAEQPDDSQSRLLTGKVVDKKTGQPVPNATVSISVLDIAVPSDSRGTFKINIPVASACTLTTDKVGYGQSNVPIDSGAENAFVEITLEPSSFDELQKMTVTASRFKDKGLVKNSEKISQITMSPEFVAKLPNLGQADLFRSIQLLPGVSGANEASSGLYIRGGTPDQNLIILDQMPIYYVDHFYGFFSAFNPRAINDITLYKGGFGSQWGGRLSSVVEMSSSGKVMKSDSNGIKAGVGTGLLSSDGFLQIPIKDNEVGTLMFAGRRSMTDFFKTDLFDKLFNRMHSSDSLSSRNSDGKQPWMPGDRIVYQPKFYFWDVNGLAAFKLGSRGKLATTFFASRDNQDNSVDTAWSTSIIRPTIDYNKKEESMTMDTIRLDTITTTTIIKNKVPVSWGNICIGQEWKQQWSDAFSTGLNLSFSQFLDEKTEDYFRSDSTAERFSDTTNPIDSIFGAVSWMTSMNKITDVSGRFDNSIRFSDWNALKAGVELSRKIVIYERDTMPTDTNSLDWKYRFVWQQQPPIRNNDTSTSLAVYAEDEMRFGDKAGLTPGVRLYYFQLASSYAFDPRISGWWKLFPEVKVKGAWGMYTQEIHRAEQEDISGGGKFIWLLTNADRPLVKSQQAIGGISWEKRHFLLDVEGYFKRMNGLLTISERMRPAGGLTLMGQPFDPSQLALFEGTGFARGVELLAQIRNVRFPLLSKDMTYDGWASYTWSRVENTYAAFNNGNPFPATQDHPHEVKLVNSLEWNVATWSSINLGAVWIYSTGAPYTAPLGIYTLTLLDSAWARTYMHVSDKNAYRLPDYHRLDLSVAWKVSFGRHVRGSLTMGLFNAYNHENILERTFTQSTVGGFDGKIKLPEMSGTQTTVFTALDKKAMSVMPNAALEISAEF